MRFRKGRGKIEKRNWRGKGKKMEEVKEYKYLGYTLQRNKRQETHVKERMRKAAAVRSVEYRKEKIRRGLEQKIVAVRQSDMDGNELWGGDMGMKREGRVGKDRRKVHKMSFLIR